MSAFMLILAIDTSTRTGSVALLSDDRLLAEVSGYEETPYSTRLFRDLEILKSRVHFEMRQIDVFAVSSGPGSFTGLRIGLTAVKAWAEVHGKPIAAISALEALCAQSTARTPQAAFTLAPFFDARRGQLFGAIFRQSLGRQGLGRQGLEGNFAFELASEESILSPEEFVDLVKGNLAPGRTKLVSPAPELIPADLLQASLPGVGIEIVSPVLAPAIGRLGFERAKRGILLGAMELDANYVRRSDAESKWKDG